MDNLKKIQEIKKQTVCKKIDGEMVIIPLVNDVIDMKEMFTLNEVGTFIWDNIDNKDNIEAIVDELTKHFDVERPVAHKDCIDFMKDVTTSFHYLLKD